MVQFFQVLEWRRTGSLSRLFCSFEAIHPLWRFLYEAWSLQLLVKFTVANQYTISLWFYPCLHSTAYERWLTNHWHLILFSRIYEMCFISGPVYSLTAKCITSQIIWNVLSLPSLKILLFSSFVSIKRLFWLFLCFCLPFKVLKISAF